MYFGCILACPPSLFKKHKGVKYFEVSAGHGDSAALREITRRWFFHGTRRGRRPSAFLCGIPFGFADESGDPGRCFRKSHRHPRAQSKLSPQKQIRKVKGGKGILGRSFFSSPAPLPMFYRRSFSLLNPIKKQERTHQSSITENPA